ncbi:hypothetical protein EDC52_101763 [Biostraticola tofi]|uniref:NinE protein n=1 Tax=Biostraticola tofi TaxID=466109 RepID=A0A4R3Z5C1_9GAMM|nr:hypothetical protein EDC52_101763 [Biostraticola tofi]
MKRRKSQWERLEEKLIFRRPNPRSKPHIPEPEIKTYDYLAPLLQARWDRTRNRRAKP